MDCCEKLKTFYPDWNGTLARDAEDSAETFLSSRGTSDCKSRTGMAGSVPLSLKSFEIRATGCL